MTLPDLQTNMLLLPLIALFAFARTSVSAQFSNGFVKGVNWVREFLQLNAISPLTNYCHQPWGSTGAYAHWLSAQEGTGYAGVYVPDDTTLAMDSANTIGAEWMRIWLFEDGQVRAGSE